MKSSLEWLDSNTNGEAAPQWSRAAIRHLIKEIQLDALKHGLTMAAKCCEGWVVAGDAMDQIIKTRDNLKELP